MYEITSHHLLQDAELEAALQAAFDRIADAPNAAPAKSSIFHEDGGRRTFVAQFERLEDARAFRADMAAHPLADGHLTPPLEDLQPEPPERIEPVWSEPAPEAAAPTR